MDCLYQAYSDHLADLGLQANWMDAALYRLLKWQTHGFKPQPTFGGVVPYIVWCLAAKRSLGVEIQHRMWTKSHYLAVVREPALKLIIRLSSFGEKVPRFTLKPAIYFYLPLFHAFRSAFTWNEVGSIMAIQLKRKGEFQMTNLEPQLEQCLKCRLRKPQGQGMGDSGCFGYGLGQAGDDPASWICFECIKEIAEGELEREPTATCLSRPLAEQTVSPTVVPVEISEVLVTPLVQVLFAAGQEQTFSFSDLAFNTDDPATISDADLIERVARHLDREVSEFSDLMVSRPTTGNILISPKPVFGKKERLKEYRIYWWKSTKWHLGRCWHEAIRALKCLWWTVRPRWLVPNYKTEPRNG